MDLSLWQTTLKLLSGILYAWSGLWSIMGGVTLFSGLHDHSGADIKTGGLKLVCGLGIGYLASKVTTIPLNFG